MEQRSMAFFSWEVSKRFAENFIKRKGEKTIYNKKRFWDGSRHATRE
jgi:hypothetical protein